MYDEDVAGLEETVVHTLQEKGLTIATAESCTGGLIAQRLTSVSGSSEVFGYGFVTYWEQAKAKLVGVDPAVIEKYNVVSAPVAAQMARVFPMRDFRVPTSVPVARMVMDAMNLYPSSPWRQSPKC